MFCLSLCKTAAVKQQYAICVVGFLCRYVERVLDPAATARSALKEDNPERTFTHPFILLGSEQLTIIMHLFILCKCSYVVAFMVLHTSIFCIFVGCRCL